MKMLTSFVTWRHLQMTSSVIILFMNVFTTHSLILEIFPTKKLYRLVLTMNFIWFREISLSRFNRWKMSNSMLILRVNPKIYLYTQIFTAQKMKFSMKGFFSKCDQSRRFPADLVTFTEEILNVKLHFLCSDSVVH